MAQHTFVARDAGLTDDELAWITWGPDAPVWTESDASVLRAVDDLDRDGIIGDATWAVLTTHLDLQQVLDLIFTAGAYGMLAWMVESLGVETRRRSASGVEGISHALARQRHQRCGAGASIVNGRA